LTALSEEDSLESLDAVPLEEEDVPGAAGAASGKALDGLKGSPEKVLAENAVGDADDGSPSPCAPELLEASPAPASLFR
jgi:hypothetical protein